LEALVRNIGIAIRTLGRRRGFSITAVLTLAAGVAANTVVFGVVWASLWRPLPFPSPELLMLIHRTASEQGGPAQMLRWSYPRYAMLRDEVQSFERIASFGPAAWNLGGPGGEPEHIDGEVVSAGYFELLGVGAEHGRTFAASEDSTPGTHPVVVVSHSLWMRRYGGDPSVLGRDLAVNGVRLTVVGIMPSGFAGLSGHAELWVPEMMAPLISYPEHLTTDQNFISVIGRLRDGVTRGQAVTELRGLGARIEAMLPDENEVPTEWSATAVSLADARIDAGNRRSLLLLMGAVGFLLLLACTNLMALGLAHAATRRREVTVRLALGSSRSGIARMLLLESAVIGVVGGALGILLAAVVVQVVHPPPILPSWINMYGTVGTFSAGGLDVPVLLFSIAVTMVAVAFSGAMPALVAGRTDLASDLRDRAGAGRRGRSRFRSQSVLVVAEIALALVLSVASGLLLVSLRALRSQPLGFRPDHLLTFQIDPPEVRYATEDAPALLDRVLAAVTAVPGVESATVDACAPVGTRCANTTLFVAGRPQPQPGQAPVVYRHYVGDDHFATLGVPLLRGRAFRASDREGSPRVAVINETAARRFWPDSDPIGERVWFGGGSYYSSADSTTEIVGVVGDVPYGSLEQEIRPSVYTPYHQFTYAFRTVIVRTSVEPGRLAAALRSAVAGVDGIPIYDVRTMEDRLGDAWATTRFNATLLGAFAIVALLLAAGGIYGVVARSVAQRRREIGIRMAVGAAGRDVLRMILVQVMRLAGLGVAIGIVLALTLGRFMRALVFDVAPTDARVFAVQSIVLFGAALLASAIPARRATRVDPLTTLRSE
jgi:putative ABC transport system permease protein